MAGTRNYTIGQRLVSVWVHEIDKLPNRRKKIRKRLFLRFNKAALNEANLRKLEKKSFSTGSILNEKHRGRARKYCSNDINNSLN